MRFGVRGAGALLSALGLVAALSSCVAPPPPPVPTGVIVVSVPGSATSANLIWNRATLTSGDAVLYYALSVDNVDVAHVAGPATNCTLVGLEPSTSYLFTVKAVSVGGSASYAHGSPGASYKTAAGTSSSVTLGCQSLNGAADSDHDGLPDWAETNTGTYVNAARAGTDPNTADTDSDGIVDGDEVLGTAGGVNLPAMGANPLHRNVFVEADGYEHANYPCGVAYSTRPAAAVFKRIRTAFASSPVTNPDGTTGLDLIVDYGQGGAFTGGNAIAGDGVLSGAIDGDFTAVKAANFASNRRPLFHYALFVAEWGANPASGVAEEDGNDLIVALPPCYNISGTAPHDDQLGNTFMHELGHNLGLQHGGTDDVGYKPDFNSVMNYQYQGDGVDTNCDGQGDGLANYSSGQDITLNEADLDESKGVCGTSPIDWNHDGTISNHVAYDINGDGALTTYSDTDEWAQLDFGGVSDTNGVRAVPTWVVEPPATRTW
jgi:hypothetical protein